MKTLTYAKYCRQDTLTDTILDTYPALRGVIQSDGTYMDPRLRVRSKPGVGTSISLPDAVPTPVIDSLVDGHDPMSPSAPEQEEQDRQAVINQLRTLIANNPDYVITAKDLPKIFRVLRVVL